NLRAARIDAEGAADAVAVEQRDQPPDANLTAVAAPGDAGVVDAGFVLRRLHAIGRRLPLRPRLQHGVDGHRDALAVRPGEGTSAHVDLPDVLEISSIRPTGSSSRATACAVRASSSANRLIRQRGEGWFGWCRGVRAHSGPRPAPSAAA